MKEPDDNSKFDKIAIHFDDEEIDPPADTGGGLLLGMEPITVDGERLKFVKEFDEEDAGAYFLSEPQDEEELNGSLPWINLLSIAGARVFTDVNNLILFVDPVTTWVELYFDWLPQTVSDPSYGSVVWTAYSSIEVWLKDMESGEVLRQLKLVPAAAEEA